MGKTRKKRKDQKNHLRPLRRGPLKKEALEVTQGKKRKWETEKITQSRYLGGLNVLTRKPNELRRITGNLRKGREREVETAIWLCPILTDKKRRERRKRATPDWSDGTMPVGREGEGRESDGSDIKEGRKK